jgi:hypothetical protein
VFEKIAGKDKVETAVVEFQTVGISLYVPDVGMRHRRCNLLRGLLQSDDVDPRSGRRHFGGKKPKPASDLEDLSPGPNAEEFDKRPVRHPI